MHVCICLYACCFWGARGGGRGRGVEVRERGRREGGHIRADLARKS